MLNQNPHTWNFPGGLVVRILCFNCRGQGFDPCSGNSDPTCHGVWPKKKKKKKKNSPTVKCIGFIYTIDKFHVFYTQYTNEYI